MIKVSLIRLGKYLLWLTLIIILGLTIRIYLIGIYLVPSQSMMPTLLPEDLILTSKFWPGSEKKVKRGGVYIFHWKNTLSYNSNCSNNSIEVLVKRLVATPGDTVTICNGIVNVNSNQATPNTIYNHYITKNTLRHLNLDIYPYDTLFFKWSEREFGPLIIPKKGNTIELNKLNIALYKEVILKETPTIVFKRDTIVQLDVSNIRKYTFKKNYYFFLGDNFYLSNDSRYLGFLSEEAIIGRVVLVLFSIDLKNVSNNRFFQIID